MRIDAIPIGKNPPEDVNVIVEVSIGGEPIKYEMDKAAGTLFVDRFLYTPMHYPGNYGFVPHTLSDDGDPVDVLVITPFPLTPGVVVTCRAIGVLMMDDEAGGDAKLLAVPTTKILPIYDHWHKPEDINQMRLKAIQHFFEHYKDLEPGKYVKAADFVGRAEAEAEVERSRERFAAEGH